MTKTPAIKCYHKLQVSSHKDLVLVALGEITGVGKNIWVERNFD